MLGQSAQRTLSRIPETVPTESLPISERFDLALVLPDDVRQATAAAEVYKLFFVFECFLRDFVLGALSEKHGDQWWDKVPEDVRNDVERLERTEEQKQWMALDSRAKLSLTTLPQLLKIIEEKENWNECFEQTVRDKSLIQEARMIAHLRNTVCHMSPVSEEETERVKQVLRDWFRVVAP